MSWLVKSQTVLGASLGLLAADFSDASRPTSKFQAKHMSLFPAGPHPNPGSAQAASQVLDCSCLSCDFLGGKLSNLSMVLHMVALERGLTAHQILGGLLNAQL